MITVTDPHRAGHELSYYPGEVTLRMADIVVINKIDSSSPEDIQKLRENIEKVNPGAPVVDAASPLRVKTLKSLKGKGSLLWKTDQHLLTAI
jgi:predicted GTPase